MLAGAKRRSQLLRKRLNDVVAAHRASAGHTVIAIVDAARRGEVEDCVVNGSDDGDSALATMPAPRAREWLAGARGLSKWDDPAADAMDVAVVASGGVTIMRLTAR